MWSRANWGGILVSVPSVTSERRYGAQCEGVPTQDAPAHCQAASPHLARWTFNHQITRAGLTQRLLTLVANAGCLRGSDRPATLRMPPSTLAAVIHLSADKELVAIFASRLIY
jgi:hypothetical protein